MSIPFLYLCGRGYNKLARAVVAPVPASSDSILGRAAALWDYSTEEPFYFDGDNRLDADLNQAVNGGFETAFSGGLPGAGWGKSAGATLTRETTGVLDEGAAVMQVVGENEYGSFDLLWPAGDVINFSTALAATLDSGGAGEAQAKIQNLETGNWLTPALAWQDAEIAWLASSNVNPFAQGLGNATVESYSSSLSDLVTLRFYFQNISPAAASRFDRFYVWPRINLVAVIGHNVPPGMLLALRSGPTSAVLNGRGAFTIAQPTMFLSTGNVDERYWRMVGGDAPDGRQVFMRDLIFGQARTLLLQREDGAGGVLIDPQDRSESGLGTLQAVLRTERGRRKLSVDFKHPAAAELAEWREIMERSRNGAYPPLMVPDSTDPASAMLCRVPPEWAHAHMRGSFNSSSAELDEMPFYATTS